MLTTHLIKLLVINFTDQCDAGCNSLLCQIFQILFIPVFY